MQSVLIPDPLSIVNELYTIGKAIYDQVQLVKANKAQSKRLGERILRIVNAIKGSDKILNNISQYEEVLNHLKKYLKECEQFIKKFTDSNKWYRYLLKTGTYNEKFIELQKQLEQAMQDLDLVMLVKQIIDHEQDKQDQAADNQFIKDHETEILQLNKDAFEKLIKLDKTQEEYHQVLYQQGEAIKERLDNISAQLVPKKPPIDPHHIISFLDLEFENKLTQGSFGKIYLGKYHNETVVIKTIEGKRSEQDQNQFEREVAIMSRLHHKNITHFYGACLESDRACIIMEYMEQGSLYDLLKQRTSLSLAQKHQIALDMTRGLYYLHKSKTLHRDLKSANVLVNAQGQAKLTDFGLAKINSASINSINARTQDIQWQAPECFKEDGCYMAQSDIYSLGTIFWELFTGQHPYEALKNNPKRLIKKITAGYRESIPESVPPVYAQLIQACWENDSMKRPKLTTILQQVEVQLTVNTPGLDNNNANTSLPIAYPGSLLADETYQTYEKAVGKGCQEALICMGLFGLRGLGKTSADQKQAYDYLLKAAQNNHALAMYKVAKLLEQGVGVEKNLEQALDWYQQAALQHDNKNVQEKAQLRYEKLKNYIVSSTSSATIPKFKSGV